MRMINKSEAILAVVIGVLALWPNLTGSVASKAIIVISAVLLLGDSLKYYIWSGKKAKYYSKKSKRG